MSKPTHDTESEAILELRRLHLFLQGFEEAAALADLASRVELQDSDPTFRGMLVGITTCYARAFTKNYGFGSIGESFCEFDDPALAEAHRSLMNFRHNRHAHFKATGTPRAQAESTQLDPLNGYPVKVWRNQEGNVVLDSEVSDLSKETLREVARLSRVQADRVCKLMHPLIALLLERSKNLDVGVTYWLGETFPVK